MVNILFNDIMAKAYRGNDEYKPHNGEIIVASRTCDLNMLKVAGSNA